MLSNDVYSRKLHAAAVVEGHVFRTMASLS